MFFLSKYFKFFIIYPIFLFQFSLDFSIVKAQPISDYNEFDKDRILDGSQGIQDVTTYAQFRDSGRTRSDSRQGAAGRLYDFDGDGRPEPGSREGGGSRGKCPSTNSRLTALIPQTNLGLTVNEYPTFWFYIPYGSKTVSQAELMLLDENRHPILEKPLLIQLSGTPGIIGIKLPPTAKPLELNQKYRWYFSLECDSENPSNNPNIDGWIKRVELNENSYQAYINNGIWYDALTQIAQSLQTNSSDPATTTQWQKLLKAVGLEKLAETLVLDCCK